MAQRAEARRLGLILLAVVLVLLVAPILWKLLDEIQTR
jgi:hypothetical protein